MGSNLEARLTVTVDTSSLTNAVNQVKSAFQNIPISFDTSQLTKSNFTNSVAQSYVKTMNKSLTNASKNIVNPLDLRIGELAKQDLYTKYYKSFQAAQVATKTNMSGEYGFDRHTFNRFSYQSQEGLVDYMRSLVRARDEVDNAIRSSERLKQNNEYFDKIRSGNAEKYQEMFDTKKMKEEASSFNKYSGDITANYQKMKQAKESIFASDKQMQAQYWNLQNFLNANTAMSKEYKDMGANILSKFDVANGAKLTKKEFAEAGRELVAFKREVSALDNTGLSFFDQLKDNLGRFSQWISATAIIIKSIQAVKKAFNDIKNIDSGMVELRKVTDATEAEYTDFYNNANKMAKDLGVSTYQIVNQTAAWGQLGYTIQEASKLAEASSIFKTISPDMTNDLATETLVSTMKAFANEGINSENILDEVASKINAVGNNFAANNADIANILTRSSSAMAAANNTLSETIALGTGAQEIVQNADTVGVALKSMSQNLRDAKKAAKVEAATGVSAYTDETMSAFKSSYQYLSDLKKIWDDLSDTQRAAATQELFGKRNAQVGLAILSNWETVEKALKTAEESQGSAMTEFGKATDGMEFKLNRLGETATGIWMKIFNSRELKSGIDALNSIAGIFDGLVSVFTSLSGGSILGELANVLIIFNTLKSGGSLVNVFGDSGQIGAFGKQLSGLISLDIRGFVAQLRMMDSISFSNIKNAFSTLFAPTAKNGKFRDLYNVIDKVESFDASYQKNGDITDYVRSGSLDRKGIAYGMMSKSYIDNLKDSVNLTDKQTQYFEDQLKVRSAIAELESEGMEIDSQIKLDATKANIKDLSLYMDQANNSAKGFTSGLTDGLAKVGSSFLNIAASMGAIFAIQMAIRGLMAVQKEWFPSLSQINEKMKESMTSYEETKSKIESLTKSYEENKTKINELAGSTGFVNKTELSELEGENRLLQTQIQLYNALARSQAEDAAEAAMKSYRKQYSLREDADASQDSFVYDAYNKAGVLDTSKKIEKNIESYKQAKKVLEDTKNNIDSYQKAQDDVAEKQKVIQDDLDNLITDQQAMKPTYDYLKVLKEQGSFLTSSQKDILTTYDVISNYIGEIQKSIDSTEYFKNSFESILGNSNIEYTSDQLFSLAQSGKYTQEQFEALISKCTNLKNAISESGMSISQFASSVYEGVKAGTQWDSILAGNENKLSRYAGEIEMFADNNYKSVKEALENANDVSGMNLENIDAISSFYSTVKGFDPGKLFENTANGIRLNATELERLDSTMRNNTIDDMEKTLSNLREQYVKVTQAIANASSVSQMNSLINTRDTIESQIAALQQYESAYKGATSALSEWKKSNSKSYEDTGAGYDYITENIKNAKELKKQGLTGKKAFQDYLQLLTDDDVSSMSYKKQMALYKKGTPIMDKYFKTGKKGAANFIGTLKKLNYAQEKDGVINIDVPDTQELAKKIGLSTEAVEQMLLKLKEYNFDIDFGETDSNFKPLEDKIINAQKDLTKNLKPMKEMKKYFNKDFFDKNGEFHIDFGNEDLEKTTNTVEGLKEAIKKYEEENEGATEKNDKFLKSLKKLEKQAEDYQKALTGSKKEEAPEKVDTSKVFDFDDDNAALSIMSAVNTLKESDLFTEGFSLTLGEIQGMNNVDEAKSKIEEVEDSLSSLEDENGKIDIETEGGQEAFTILNALYTKEQEISNHPIVMDVDTGTLTGDTKKGIEAIQNYVNAYNKLKTQEKLKGKFDIDTQNAQAELDKAKSALDSMPESVKTALKIDTSSIQSINQSISNINKDVLVSVKVSDENFKGYTPKDKEARINIKVGTDEYKSYKPQVKDGKVNISIGSNTYSSWKPKNKTAYVDVYRVEHFATGTYGGAIAGHGVTGKSRARGQNSGFAYAKGQAIRNKSLVGELGRELLVDPNTGEFTTIGDHGAEFYPVGDDDIIFNHKQTEQLLKYGRIASRGKLVGNAFIHGKAYTGAKGSGPSLSGSSKGKKKKKSTSKKSSSSKSSSSKSSSKKKTKKKKSSSSSKKDATYFDWIERKIKSIQDELDVLASKRDNIYNHWSTRNKSLSDELSKLKTQYDNQSKAATAYLKAANAVGLSSEYVKKIQSGNFSIQGIKDEKLIDKINKYKEYYDNYKKAQLEQYNLQKEIDDNLAEQFELIKTKYESLNKPLEDNNDLLENQVDLWEYLGQVGNSDNINNLSKQMNNNRTILKNLNAEYDELSKKLSEIANSSGGVNFINTSSEGYAKLKSELDEVASKIVEVTTELSELSKDKFDAITEDFEARLDYIEARSDVVEGLMDLAEAQGNLASEGYYKSLISLAHETIGQMEEERDALNKQLNASLDDGTITQYSKAWYEMMEEIQSVDKDIIEAKEDLADFNQEMKEVSWEKFERLQDSIEDFIDELEMFYDLFESNDRLFDDNGAFSSDGLAALGTKVSMYKTYTEIVKQYTDAIEDLNNQYKDDPLNVNYLDKRAELIKSQREAILNAQDEKEAIQKLVEDGYDKQLDALQKIIDARKKALDQEKEAYEYQKDIAEKTKEVAKYQRQLLAYGGDNSEEGRLNAQNARTNLRKAQDDLRETQWDKYIEDTEKILDDLYDDVEAWLNKRIDDIDGTLHDAIEIVDANASSITDTISSKANEVGYTITDELKAMLTDSTVMNYQNGVTSALNTIISLINSLQSIADKNAKSSTSSADTSKYISQQDQTLAQKSAREAAEKAAAEAAKASSSSSASSSETKKDDNKNDVTWATVQAKARSGLVLSGTKLKGVKFTPEEIAILKSHKGKQISYDNGKGGLFDATISGEGNLYYNSKGTVYKYNVSSGKVTTPLKYNKTKYKKLANKGKVGSLSGANVWQEYKEALHARGIKGYSHGGIVGSPRTLMKLNGDDQFTVNTLKTGESVFDVKTTDILKRFNEQASSLDNLIRLADSSKLGVGAYLSATDIDKINVSIALPNVKNYDDFKNSLISDKKFNNAMFDAVNNALTGKGNSLAKNKWKK